MERQTDRETDRWRDRQRKETDRQTRGACLGWFHEHGPDYVRAVGLVPDAQAADDGAKVQPLIGADDAELELVVASTLNDGGVADLHLRGHRQTVSMEGHALFIKVKVTESDSTPGGRYLSSDMACSIPSASLECFTRWVRGRKGGRERGE